MSSQPVPHEALDENLRYPVGRFQAPDPISAYDRTYAIATLAELPSQLRNVVTDLDPEQLDTPYRPGGWTVRQVVHHMADSHMNAQLRIRKALTEDSPAISLYDQQGWATLHDHTAPVEWSLSLIESLHARWVMLLQSLDDHQWVRVYLHPELGPYSVERATLHYAWHCRHHVAHIAHLREREGW